jgi:hypothetical protein
MEEGGQQVTRTPYEEGRRAKMPINLDLLGAMLDLPEGYVVHRVWVDQDPMRVWVGVTGPDLEPVLDDCESPYLRGTWDVTQVEAGGRLFARWAWTPT